VACAAVVVVRMSFFLSEPFLYWDDWSMQRRQERPHTDSTNPVDCLVVHCSVLRCLQHRMRRASLGSLV